MFDIFHYVEDLDISDGMTVRRDCPICRGNKTFTASNRDGFLIWNCYKAGCKASGGVKTHMTAEDVRVRLTGKQNKNPVLFSKPECVIPIENAKLEVQYWIRKWCVWCSHHGYINVRWTKEFLAATRLFIYSRGIRPRCITKNFGASKRTT